MVRAEAEAEEGAIVVRADKSGGAVEKGAIVVRAEGDEAAWAVQPHLE